jgi:tetratricopeptide (TPR) repeat protein
VISIETIRAFSNPYRFNAPIRHRDALIGRLAQLHDVEYYLDDARGNESPVSLAILGERNAGKTSFLNVIEDESEHRSYLTVRLNLTEDDTTSAAVFVERLIGTLLRKLLHGRDAAGEFLFTGGPDGRAAEILEIYAAGSVASTSFDEFPFRMPRIIARNKGTNTALVVAEDILLDDLQRVQDIADCPVVILIDEGDVLTRNRALLQLLRNLMMNLKHYVLVLTGTPALFEVVDAIFSPIARQFKKISIGPFLNRTEVERSIRAPLDSLKAHSPDTLFNFGDESKIREIAIITGRRPYEVNLLCHFMFKDMQARGRRAMELNADVLDEVRQELGRGHTLASRPLFGKIRNLSKTELSLLSDLMAGEGQVTIPQYWFNRCLRERRRIPFDEFETAISRYVELGLLRIANNSVQYTGDDLDRIYLRYYALSQNTIVASTPSDFRTLLTLELDIEVNSGESVYYSTSEQAQDTLVLQVLEALSSGSELPPRVSGSQVVYSLYEGILPATESADTTAVALQVSLNTPFGADVLLLVYVAKDSTKVEAIRNEAHAAEARLNAAIDLDMHIEVLEYRLPPADQIASAIRDRVPPMALSGLALMHRDRLMEAYLYKDDPVAALAEARLMQIIDPTVAPVNAGYLFLRFGEIDRARSAFQAGIKAAEPDIAVAQYDLGVIYALENRIDEAISLFKDVSTTLQEFPIEAATLFVPIASPDGGLVWVEQLDPDIERAAEGAVSLLQLHRNGGKLVIETRANTSPM